MTVRRVQVIEGTSVAGLTLDEIRLVRAELDRLGETLKPRFPFWSGTQDQFKVMNLVGTVEVTPRLVLDVAPKVPVGADWAGALVDLLTVRTRAKVGGVNDRAERRHARVLPDAFADLYASQLDRALRREGPLTLLEPHTTSSPVLTGRLDVTKWLTSRTFQPARFPQHRTRLTPDNAFTSALAWAAQRMASRTSDPGTAARLDRLSITLRPGLPPHVTLPPGIALRALPAQWRAYVPAWETARLIIKKIAPLHRGGALTGLGLALEPWPLLETLLETALRDIGRLAMADGLDGVAGYGHTGNKEYRTPLGATPEKDDQTLNRLHRKGFVNPDGVVTVDGVPAVALEAKYVEPTAKDIRDHAFQAITTAAVLGASAAVIVYPEAGPTVSWDLTGFGGTPARLHAVGLDMYSYRYGDSTRSSQLYDLLKPVLVSRAVDAGGG